MNKKIWTEFLLTLLAGMAIPLCIYKYVTFNPPLSNEEKELLAFSPINATISRPIAHVATNIDCPVSIQSKKPTNNTQEISRLNYPSTPLDKLFPIKKSKRLIKNMFRLSLVLIQGQKKLAIINNEVIKEGESFSKYRVSQIEDDKVKLEKLVGDKGALWVPADKS